MPTTAASGRDRTLESPQDSSNSVAAQSRIVFALRNALAAAGNANVKVIETHISFVLLTGTFAYKLKKSVDFGFLDFTTLSRRKFYCHEELRLNRRLARSLYLDVVPITGTTDAPQLGGDGPPIEYAVKMREFAQDALASVAASRQRLSATHIDALAAEVAAFHVSAARALPNTPFGTADGVRRFALQNFGRIRPLLTDPAEVAELDALRKWTRDEHAVIAAAIEARRAHGQVRECHGDLHLGNIALIDEHPVIFDGIEFDDALRWIDVMSEAAFTVMDLMYRGQDSLARRFLNAYLEATGDYDGLAVLRFYLVYRAMVRAMVVRERAHQLHDDEAQTSSLAEYRGYVSLAKRFTHLSHPALIITHGVSGSGKTVWSQTALEMLVAIRVRTDVERKRAYGIDSRDHRHAGNDSGLYGADATFETYRRSLASARAALMAGWITIVDGAFLMRWQRAMFHELAREVGAPFLIVDLIADASMLRARVARRLREANDASDADLSVLDHQLRTRESFTEEELGDVVTLEADGPREPLPTCTAWTRIADRIGGVPQSRAL